MDEIERLREENRLMRAALEMYADPKQWDRMSDGYDTYHNTWGDDDDDHEPWLTAAIALNPDAELVVVDHPRQERPGQEWYKERGYPVFIDERHWTIHFLEHELLNTSDPRTFDEAMTRLRGVVERLRGQLEEDE